MLRVTISTLAGALALSLLSPPEASGQRVTSPYEFIEGKQDLGVWASYFSTDPGSANLGPKSTPAIGVGYARRVSRPVTIGLLAHYLPSERDVVDPSTDDSIPRTVGSKDLDLLLVSGRLNITLTGPRTWHNLAPYLIGGVGMIFELSGSAKCFEDSTDPDCELLPRERFEFGSSFVWQIGFGTAWLPTERLGLRLEVSDDIWRLKTPPGWYDVGLGPWPIPPAKDWTNNWQFGLAVTYWF